MMSSKIFLVLTFAHCVFSDKIIKEDCYNKTEDFVPCVTELMQDFFRKNSGGLPDHNIKAVDPITIPEVIMDDQKLGLKVTYKTIKVTGFKDVVISNVKFNHKELHTQLNMKFDLVAEGDITTEIRVPQNKSLSGTFKYEANVNADISYTENKVNNNGVDYNIGSETINCDASNIKKSFNAELTEAFEKDPATENVKAEFKKSGVREEYNKTIICKIATVVFRESIDVLRKIGK